MTETKDLAEALAVLMTKLPRIGKSNEAEVETKQGRRYTYNYADLADISRQILPIIGELGLSFTSRPTTTADGRFVLAYKLLHVSGEAEAGEYPLPTTGTPQAVGSAITYARRYCLCAVTGVAPEDDDDGAAAQAEYRHPAERSTAQRDEPQWETPLPEAKTDQAWATKFETRIGEATSAGMLRGLYEEMVLKHKRRELTDDDRARLEQVGTLRDTELKESPA